MSHLIDYHTHTNYGWDAKYPMEEMITNAISMGISELAFTDHVDPAFENGVPTGQFRHFIDWEKYINEFNTLKEKYKGKIRLVLGVEISIEPISKHITEAFLASWPFEFVIGSMHDVNGIDMFYPAFYEGKTKRQAYEEYFINMKNTAQTVNGFHVFGHLDYVERYGAYEDRTLVYEEYADMIDSVLRAIIQNGKGIEINTAGGKHFNNPGPNDIAHPRFKILKRYKELGGEIITMGSDAHSPERIGHNFTQAKHCLLAAGFKAMTVYRQGKPVFIDL